MRLGRWFVSSLFLLFLVMGPGLVLCGPTAVSAEPALPNAQPVPRMQAVPLPGDRVSFRRNNRELTRYHYGPSVRRPYWFPIIGPVDRSLTRIGHPHGPDHHGHHASVWLAHRDIGGVNFWENGGEGRIVHDRLRQFHDGEDSAWMLSINRWVDGEGNTVIVERRRSEARPLDGTDWLMRVDLQFEAPGDEPVTIGASPYGIFAVRVAKSMTIRDGGGRILNSHGKKGEEPVFRKPARWVDYSGRIAPGETAGITLMDHPTNPSHPTPFHVREDGWMGASLTLKGGITVKPGKPLRLRYGLWVHEGVPDQAAIDKRWQHFSKTELPPMTKQR